MKLLEGASGALISEDGNYRYALWRRWAPGKVVLFVMLNPSTADALLDDPTIRRCVGFAKSWGYGALLVGNLFAFRTPSPDLLKSARDPIGPENDLWLKRCGEQSDLIVGAWGNHGDFLGRDKQVRALVSDMKALDITQSGQPKHPLYVPGDTLIKQLI